MCYHRGVTQKDRSNLAFPPPLGLLIALIATYCLARWLPLGLLDALPAGLVKLLGWGLIIVGALIDISGAYAFRQARTNINPYKPALTIVRSGPYRFTRNPMYLGMVLITAGVGLVMTSLWGPIMALVLFLALHNLVVLREEAYLEAKFGDEYRALLSSTRRWL